MMQNMKQRWRKTGKRGVSPIIATILLVAITVVLAAVLYILISGLTKGPGNTPLGSAFAWGSAKNNTSTGAATFSYSVPVASANGLTLNNLKFEIVTPQGTLVSAGLYTISVLSITGATLGVYSFAAGGSWTSGGTTQVSASQTVWLHAGTAGLLGDNMIALGQGSFSGQVSSGAFS